MKAFACAAGVAATLTAANAGAQQSDPFTVESGEQDRTWQSTEERRDIATPLHKVYKDRAGEIFITTLGVVPYKPVMAISTAYKRIDMARKIADKSFDEGLKDADARLIFIGHEGEKLKRLIDAGKSKDTDPETAAAYRALSAQVVIYTNTNFALDALLRHGLYATARVGVDELISKAIKKCTRWLGIKARVSRFGFGRDVQRAWQGEGRVLNQLSRTAWKKLNERTVEVRKFLDDYQNALIDYALKKMAAKEANAALDGALEKLGAEARRNNPSNPAPQGPLFVRGEIRQLIQVRPVAMAQVAAAVPIAVFVRPPVVVRVPDPVVQAIYKEDAFVYRSTRTTSSPSSSPPPRPAPVESAPPEPRRPFGSGPRLTWTQQKQPNWDGRRQP